RASRWSAQCFSPIARHDAAPGPLTPAMLAAATALLVGWSTRRAPAIVLAAVLGTGLCGNYAAHHLSVDTDTEKLISPDLPWRKQEAVFERAFPQNVDLLALVVDGVTAGQAEDAAAAL